MKIDELKRPQLVELKQNYMAHLAEEGRFVAEIYGEGEEREPSYGELADADSLVPDGVIWEYYGGINFVREDFFDTEGLPEEVE